MCQFVCRSSKGKDKESTTWFYLVCRYQNIRWKNRDDHGFSTWEGDNTVRSFQMLGEK